MVKIKLYQPGVVDVDIAFPETWHDLTGCEVLSIAAALIHEGHSKPEIFLSILRHRLPSKVKMKSGWEFFLDNEDLAINGLPLIDFIYQENTLVSPAEAFIIIGKKKLFAPADWFANLTCGEYEDAEQALYAFLDATKDAASAAENAAAALAELAAILYRPNGQPYTWYDNKHGNMVYDRSKIATELKALEANRLFAIYLWYAGCRSYIPKMFPAMHEPDPEATTADDNPAMNFVKCIHAGAGVKNGTRDKIRQMKLLEFLFDMEQEAIKAKELKAMYANQK